MTGGISWDVAGMSTVLGRTVSASDMGLPFEALGLDSLDLVLLLLEAEAQGVVLPEALISELTNLGDLAHYVSLHQSNPPAPDPHQSAGDHRWP